MVEKSLGEHRGFARSGSCRYGDASASAGCPFLLTG
jgi:hypothetical protein